MNYIQYIEKQRKETLVKAKIPHLYWYSMHTIALAKLVHVPWNPGRSGNTWKIVNEVKYAPAGGETISRSMSGWLKIGSASAIILMLTSAKKWLTTHENCS
jgi:hypothetical protein